MFKKIMRFVAKGFTTKGELKKFNKMIDVYNDGLRLSFNGQVMKIYQWRDSVMLIVHGYSSAIHFEKESFFKQLKEIETIGD